MEEEIFEININGEPVKVFSEREVIATVFSLLIRHSNFSSMEWLKTNMMEASEMIKEFLSSLKEKRKAEGRKSSEVGKLTRLITKFTEFQDHVQRCTDRNILLTTLYNMTLSYEGLGLLNGFGMSNRHGDKLLGNPEVQSLKPSDYCLKSDTIQIITKKNKKKKRKT